MLDFSKVKEFADDSFKLKESGRKVFQQCRKHCGKRRNCSLRAISSFPTASLKKPVLHTRKKPGLVWERDKTDLDRMQIMFVFFLTGFGQNMARQSSCLHDILSLIR